MFPPERIVCLTEETVETLYLLGEEQRIAGVSGYAVRPARVRHEKPRVAAFISSTSFTTLHAAAILRPLSARVRVDHRDHRTHAASADDQHRPVS